MPSGGTLECGERLARAGAWSGVCLRAKARVLRGWQRCAYGYTIRSDPRQFAVSTTSHLLGETMDRPTLLIVDDNDIVREVLRASFETAGFEVQTLSSAFQVNAAISAHRPDLILLDVHMPALRGDKAAAILGQRRFLEEIPIVLISDSDEAELARLAAEAGASGYVKKTPDHQHLVETVRGFLRAQPAEASAATSS